MALGKPAFEQGPIRPPSEALSLLLRFNRNCPWNRCLFCPVYKGKKFSRRSFAEIKQDILAVASAVEKIKELSFRNGFGGNITREVLALIKNDDSNMLSVAFWQYHGAETVFLQDGDALMLPTVQLLELLRLLHEHLPGVKRITTYARSATLLRRSAEELRQLKSAGLNRIHVGLESGHDPVLAYMQKGITGAQHVAAGLKVKEAGMELSEYVILGLGGSTMWRGHALDTAKALNAINPDFIRVRTLAIHPVSPLYGCFQQGEFVPLNDEGVLREEKLLLENLQGINSAFYSDHILNLLEEVCGQLPEDLAAMIEVIERYFALSTPQRECFRLGRRTGYYRSLTDMENLPLAGVVENLYRQLQKEG
ncbi:MAG TPA: radical SAM protein, partial [Candidatus Limnocylindrales bacterium]|nr:radical SAM protein [Candidatus Limnocylindrales bacterium]